MFKPSLPKEVTDVLDPYLQDIIQISYFSILLAKIEQKGYILLEQHSDLWIYEKNNYLFTVSKGEEPLIAAVELPTSLKLLRFTEDNFRTELTNLLNQLPTYIYSRGKINSGGTVTLDMSNFPSGPRAFT